MYVRFFLIAIWWLHNHESRCSRIWCLWTWCYMGNSLRILDITITNAGTIAFERTQWPWSSFVRIWQPSRGTREHCPFSFQRRRRRGLWFCSYCYLGENSWKAILITLLSADCLQSMHVSKLSSLSEALSYDPNCPNGNDIQCIPGPWSIRMGWRYDIHYLLSTLAVNRPKHVENALRRVAFQCVSSKTCRSVEQWCCRCDRIIYWGIFG